MEKLRIYLDRQGNTLRQPTPHEQQAALAGMSEIGATVEASLKEQGMTIEDAEHEIRQAIAEVRCEKART